jgi:1,4-alpha-glucan branching enzyme
MGWMNDTLDFFKKTPDERKDNYHKLTFSMMYFPNERYLLPLSHDENVHGKATVLNKMYGDYWDKFPQARVFYLYMYVHPGKKLNFMGGEFGQMREWDERREQDWDMLDYPIHDAFAHYMAALCNLYLDHGALSEWDYYAPGFSWLDCNQEQRCLYAIERKNAGERLVAVLNMGGEDQRNYKVAVAGAADGCDVLLHTDWECWGGKTGKGAELVTFKDEELTVTLPPFSGVLLKVYEPEPEPVSEPEE